MSVIDKDPFACKLACHIVKQQFHDICEVNLLTMITAQVEECFKSSPPPPMCIACRQPVELCWRKEFRVPRSLHVEPVIQHTLQVTV